MGSNPLNTPARQEWALGMARHLASRSKDPSTKVGAIIFDAKSRIVGAGFNGFPRGVEDRPDRLEDREKKYRMVIHAESNALMFATGNVEGATMLVTHPCCARCAAVIIQAGISHVMWPKPSEAMAMRWAEDFEAAAEMFEEAGVQVHVI
jgi:dCMP deaminase